MIIDGNLLFDGSGTPLAGVNITTTQTSTNVLDLVNERDLGVGDDPALKVMVLVTTAFTGTSPTLNVQFQGAPDNGSGAPGTWATFAESGVLPAASLTANTLIFKIDVPQALATVAPGALPRFYRLNYVAGGTISTGAVIAGIVLDRGAPLTYPSGFTVNN